MDKRLTKLTWITVIVVLLFILWIKYQLTTSGSGEWNELGYTNWNDLHLQSKYD